MKSSFALTLIALLCSVGQAQDTVSKPAAPVKAPPRVTGVEVIARLAEQPTHIARTPDGRIFTVLFDSLSDKARLVEVKAGGETAAYPDEKWNAGRNPDGTGFTEIVGLEAGHDGWLGIIDAGNTSNSPRVVVWDTRTNKVVGAQDFDTVKREPGAMRFVQDIAVDVPHRCLYTVASSRNRKTATVYVMDLNTKSIREFPISKGATLGAPVPTDKTEASDSASFRWGMSIPIAIDPSCKWVYLGGIGGKNIFRVATSVLADPNLNSETLLRSMELYGSKSLSSHIAADDYGNVYCAEANTNKIGVCSKGRSYRTFLQDPILNYPYALQVAPEGYVYISVNQVQRLKERGSSTIDPAHPFLIVRAKALAQ